MLASASGLTYKFLLSIVLIYDPPYIAACYEEKKSENWPGIAFPLKVGVDIDKVILKSRFDMFL